MAEDGLLRLAAFLVHEAERDILERGDASSLVALHVAQRSGGPK